MVTHSRLVVSRFAQVQAMLTQLVAFVLICVPSTTLQIQPRKSVPQTVFPLTLVITQLEFVSTTVQLVALVTVLKLLVFVFPCVHLTSLE